MTNLTVNSMGHLLYLSKLYLTPCQSQQQSKMRHILSHSWLNYNWRTKAAMDDFHHHRSMQVKRDDHTFSCKNCMETNVHSTKTKIWASFHKPRRLHHSKTNEQSGFNGEHIEKDRYLESKTIWRINLIINKHSKIKNSWLRIDQWVITKEDYISLKVLHSLQRLMLGC